MNQFK